MASLIDPAPPVSYPTPKFALANRHVDEPRPLKVAIIGAGLAGVLAGAILPAKVPNIQLTIFEKNVGVGGTWFENVYPGVRCDVPAHVYQSTFHHNTNWSEQFAQGAEIRDYWQNLAKTYGVDKLVRFGHKVVELAWDEKLSKWTVRFRKVSSSSSSSSEQQPKEKEEEEEEKFDFVINAIGRFNAWRMPSYPDQDKFQGLLRHASHYDPSIDLTGKRVAVIGNGASGIQLVANLQKRVGHLDHYARNKTWVSASFAGDATSIDPLPISPEEREIFASDPKAYLAYRKSQEDKYWRGFKGWLKGSEQNAKAKKDFTELMRGRIGKRKPELADSLIPDFDPHCRRLTPGPGYLEALAEDNVTYITDPIARLTSTGIVTKSSSSSSSGEEKEERPVDAILCATGANVDQVPPFPIIIPSSHLDLRDVWRPHPHPSPTSQQHQQQQQQQQQSSSSPPLPPPTAKGFPYTYLGLATPSFPNLFFLLGPNSSGRSGTIPHAVETQTTYLARLLRKMATQGIVTVRPKREAADEWTDYCDTFFSVTTLSSGCRSWYNGGREGGRVHGIWPGSAAHMSCVLREGRWEDWEWGYEEEEEEEDDGDDGEKKEKMKKNRFRRFFGDGCTGRELDLESDMTGYLKEGGGGGGGGGGMVVEDLRGLHEDWWRVP